MIFIVSQNNKYLAFHFKSYCQRQVKLGVANSFLRKQHYESISFLNQQALKYSFTATSSTYKIQDFYQLLGVPQNASQDEIKKAYFKKAKDLHPDVQGYDQVQQEQRSSYQEQLQDDFKRITDAYNTLKDPSARQKYDYDNFIYKQEEEYSQGGKYDQSRGYYQHQTRNPYAYDWYKEQMSQEGYTYNQGYYGYNSSQTSERVRNSEKYREFYKDYDRVYNPNSYTTKSSYESQINKEPTWKRWKLHWVAALGLFIIYDFVRDAYIDRVEMMTEKELELKIREMKDQKGLFQQKDAEVRRDNYLLSKQTTVNDPIFVQEKRRAQFEKELADQNVKIEVSYIDTTSQNPYAASKDKVRKYKTSQDFYTGQNALLEYAKNEKMKIEKTPDAEMKLKKIEKPRRGTILEVAQLADDEYI